MGTATASWWGYSRWLYVISRSMLITPPQGAELPALATLIKNFWNTKLQTGTRPWLQSLFNTKSAQPHSAGSAPGNPDYEPTYNDVKLLQVISRDIKKIPLTDAEKVWCDTFFGVTGYRKYGDKPYYGNTI